jgi:beta-glucanase (GH16 family)
MTTWFKSPNSTANSFLQAGLVMVWLLLAGEALPQNKVLFYDDFDGPSLDSSKWIAGFHQWGPDNQGVVPENLSIRTIVDEGKTISVLDTQANGDLYDGPVRGVRREGKALRRTADGKRTGGLVITAHAYGAGRYEVRMKNLPLPGGCSCIWNIWDPQDQGGPAGDYSEIDIEMPANGYAARDDWMHWAGFNTYYPSPNDITAINTDIGSQNDGKFHVYRWDWYDGMKGPKRVEFYVDGLLMATSRANIPHTPATLWVGNWPAKWSGDFNYQKQHLYVDWVRISTLEEKANANGAGPSSVPPH